MKAFLRYLISFMLVVSVLCVSAFAVDVYIDGEMVLYNDDTGYPFSENGNVLVPLYPTMEAFGNDGIFQDNPNGTVVIRRGNINVSCNTAENRFCRNGTYIASDYGLVWRGGPLYVSADIFSAFDAQVSIGGSGVIVTRGAQIGDGFGVYASSYDKAYRGTDYFGAKYEPENGVYLGCISKSSYSEAEVFAGICKKDAAAFTVYASFSEPYEKISGALDYAVQSGKLVRLLVSDFYTEGLDTETIKELAKNLEASGARILLSPVGKGNCRHGVVISDAEGYAEYFRTVSEIFRSNAPSVAIVWQVCGCDTDNFNAYYPGDVYADYVEISLCDYDSFDSEDISEIVAVYGYRKPITVFADFEKRQQEFKNKCLELFTYLPVKYPQVKAVFFYAGADGTEGETDYINNLRSGIGGSKYLENPNLIPKDLPYSFELASNVTVPPSKTKLCCGFDKYGTEISRVVYMLGGKEIATAENMPYEAEADFSALAGKSVVLRVVAYSNESMPLVSKDYTLNVGELLSADESMETGKIIYKAAFGVAVLISLLGIAVVLKKIRDIFG